MKLFASIYKLDEKRSPNFHFNKILIDFKSADYGDGNVYFISEENQQVYSSHVLATSLNQFSQDYFEEAKQYNQYFSFKTGTGRTIYLPEGRNRISKQSIFIQKTSYS